MWNVVIKMDFKEVNCDDVKWIELAEDSFQFQLAFVVVMNLHFT
jgi:hypothetical protein